MKDLINLLIGLAMSAVSAVVPGGGLITGFVDFAQNFGLTILNTNSEFFGDGSQGFIKDCIDAIKRRKEFNKIKNLISVKNVEKSVLDKIFSEIAGREVSEEKISKLSKRQMKRLCKKQDILNCQAIVKLSRDVLFNVDIKGYICQCSTTFSGIDDEIQNEIVACVELAIKVYTQDMFAKTEEENQLLASVIFNAVKNYIDFANDELKDELLKALKDELPKTILPFIANQNDGHINIQEVALSQYMPKYILHACPRCGYDGDRLYTDEKTNITYCAACGGKYSIMEYCEPEEFAKINSSINNLTDHFDDFTKEARQYFGDNTEQSNKIIGFLTEMKKQQEAAEERIKEAIKNKQKTTEKSIKDVMLEGFEQVANKEYLYACLKNQAEAFEFKFDSIMKKYLEQIAELNKIPNEDFDGIREENEHNHGELLSALDTVNKRNEKYNEYISQQLVSLGQQINSIYNKAEEKFADLGEKSDMILDITKQLCTQEFFNEKYSALGSNINNAIDVGVDKIVALSAENVARVLAKLDDIRVVCTGREGADLEKTLRIESVKISSEIQGVVQVIEKCDVKSERRYRALMEELEKIQRINFGTSIIGDFEKIYLGQIPDKYTPDNGFADENHPCQYCGATGTIRFNHDKSKVRCSACGKEYLWISPFCIDDARTAGYIKNVSENILPTNKNRQQWIKEHTCELKISWVNNDIYEVKLPDTFDQEGKCLIIPDKDVEGNNITAIGDLNTNDANVTRVLNNIGTVIFGDKLVSIGLDNGNTFMDQFHPNLKRFVFLKITDESIELGGSNFDTIKSTAKDKFKKLECSGDEHVWKVIQDMWLSK